MSKEAAPRSSALEEHGRHKARHQAEAERLEGRSNRLSMVRLVVFLAAVVLISAGFSQNAWPTMIAGVVALAAFIALLIVHARIERARLDRQARAEVHARHELRLTGRFTELASAGKTPPGHPYAHDIDLVGANSLCQRIDTSHTVLGEATLSRWLARRAEGEEIIARQEAVEELAPDVEFRERLEAAGSHANDDGGRLDPAGFLEFTRKAPMVRGKPLALAALLLPPTTLGLFIAAQLGALPNAGWLVALGVQLLLALGTSGRTLETFQLVAARRGYVESLKGMLVAIEDHECKSPMLAELRRRVSPGGRPPSDYMARLDRWAGFAEFYTQFPVHFFVNILVLWDLHVLWQLERWNAEVGQGLEDAFDALGDLEALCSLAALRHGDESARLPTILPADHEGAIFEARGLAHPLLPVDQRVANDVELPGPASALIITGSNMAGKSTLLRSVGLNIALAFAGGPVIAEAFSIAPLRLRASMRVDDSLQKGASYFHAELAKLRSVVEGADASPPIFFLLDELLRGTNARARHIGARAVLAHLLDRGGSGLSATHDIALAKLEDERPGHIRNVHFTDVMQDGEMIFDYRLRDGVVKTSNALRLLEMVGVEVEVDDRLHDDGE